MVSRTRTPYSSSSLLIHLPHLFLLLFCIDYGHALPLSHAFLPPPPPPPPPSSPPPLNSNNSSPITRSTSKRSPTPTHLDDSLPPGITIPGLHIKGPLHVAVGSHLINASSPFLSSAINTTASLHARPRAADQTPPGGTGTDLSYGSNLITGGSLCSIRKLAPGAFADHADARTVRVYYGSTLVDGVDVEHVATDAEGWLRFDGGGRPVMKMGFEGEEAWARVLCKPSDIVDPTASSAESVPSNTGSSYPDSATPTRATSATVLPTNSMEASVTISRTASRLPTKALLPMTTDVSSSSSDQQRPSSPSMTVGESSSSIESWTTLLTAESSTPTIAFVTVASSIEASKTTTQEKTPGSSTTLIVIPKASITISPSSDLLISQATSTFSFSSSSSSSSPSSPSSPSSLSSSTPSPTANTTVLPLPSPNSAIHSLDTKHISPSTRHALSKILPGVIIGSALFASGLLGILHYLTSHPDRIDHATRIIDAYAKGYRPFDRSMWQRFWDADFADSFYGQQSSRASSVWTGEFSIPPMGETVSMAGGGSQLSLPEGQAVEVVEGTVIRTEEAGTIVAETQGAIEVCQGICGEIGSAELPIEMPPGEQVDIVINSTPEGIREFTEFRVRRKFRMNFRGGDVTMRMPGGQPYRITNTPSNPPELVKPGPDAPANIEPKPVLQDPIPQEAPKPTVQNPVPEELPKPAVQDPVPQEAPKPTVQNPVPNEPPPPPAGEASKPKPQPTSQPIQPGQSQSDRPTSEPPWLKHVPSHPPSHPTAEKLPSPVLKPVPQPADPAASKPGGSGKFEKPPLKPIDAAPKSPAKDPQSGRFEKPPLKPIPQPPPFAPNPGNGKFEKPALKPIDSSAKPPAKDPQAGKFEKPPLRPIPRPPPSNPPEPGKFPKPPLKPLNNGAPKTYDPITGEPQAPTGSRPRPRRRRRRTSAPSGGLGGGKSFSVIRFEAWNETRWGLPPPEVGPKPAMTLLEFVARVMEFQEGKGEGKGEVQGMVARAA